MRRILLREKEIFKDAIDINVKFNTILARIMNCDLPEANHLLDRESSTRPTASPDPN